MERRVGRMVVRFTLPLLLMLGGCIGSDPALHSGSKPAQPDTGAPDTGMLDSGPPAAGPPHSEPSRDCGEPKSGEPCTCPGSSACPADASVEFKCLDSGIWEKTDLSCVLGLNCRTSADCMSGEACCGDPYKWPGGTQITSSSCRSAPCSSDTVQLCQSSAECAQPRLLCVGPTPAFGGGSVMLCSAGNSK
jgi:hypothetical protein